MNGFWKGWIRPDPEQNARAVMEHLGKQKHSFDSAEVQFVHWQEGHCYSVTIKVEREGGVTVSHGVSEHADGFPDVNTIHEVYINGFDPDDLTDLRTEEDET